MSEQSVPNPTREPMILEEKSKKTESWNKKNQYIAGVIVSLGGFCAGTVLAWTSPALEYLLENDNNLTSNNSNHRPEPPGFKISTTEEACVGATLMLGGLLFAIPSGKCADMFGRKITLILTALLYLVNYILIACSNNVMMLIVARFLAGLALGGCCVVSPMYIGEFADESLRGVLGSFFGVQVALGILYVNIVGIFANWIWLSIFLAIPSLIAAIAMLFLPDTPIYLIKVERFGKARRSLMFFKGDETIVCDELIQIQKSIAAHEEGVTIYEMFTTKEYRKPLIAGLGVFMYQQLCGINIVVFYLVPIFKAAGSSINPLVAATTTNFISLIVGIISVFVIEKRSRKYFLILSAFSMLTSTVGIAIFFELKENDINFLGIQVLPMSCVVLFMAAFAIGLGPVPWILLIELYGPEIRATASGLSIVSNWLAAFVVTFSYPYFMQILGSSWTFYILGLLNLLGIVFIWFVVPETRKVASKK